jgi:hypothetical protein
VLVNAARVIAAPRLIATLHLLLLLLLELWR